MTRHSLASFALPLVTAALLSQAGCSPQKGRDTEAVTAAVTDIWTRYSSSLNSGDLDRWMSLWADNGVQMPPDEPPVIGKEAIRARMKAVLARISDLKVGDNAVEDIRSLCSCVKQAQASLLEVDTQWVRAKISLFNSRSTGSCASIFKDRG